MNMKSGEMHALQILAPGHAVWRTAPIPQPQAHEVLIKVEGVTTCPHWDLHIMSGEPMFPGFELKYPYYLGQPGHEMAGEIVALGSAVSDFKTGTRIAVWRDSGQRRPGCYAHYVALPAENIMAVPRDLPIAAIASFELAMCVQVSFDQLTQYRGIAGKRVGITGLGPSGLLAVQMAKAYGAAEIVGIDPLLERRELAQRLGADRAYAPNDAAFPADRAAATALDLALDTTGLKISIEAMMACTKEVVTMFGVLREQIEFGPAHWYGGFALLGYGEHNHGAAERALQLILNGKLQLATVVSRTMPLYAYAEAVALLREKKAIKILFEPWSS